MGRGRMGCGPREKKLRGQTDRGLSGKHEGVRFKITGWGNEDFGLIK